MVEIKKHGTKPEPKAKAVKTFTCPKCGCEFDTDEYSNCAERCPNGKRWIEVQCPEEDCKNKFSVEVKASALLG